MASSRSPSAPLTSDPRRKVGWVRSIRDCSGCSSECYDVTVGICCVQSDNSKQESSYKSHQWFLWDHRDKVSDTDVLP